MMENEKHSISTKDIEDILAIIREAPRELAAATEEVKYLDDKQQDILHELELTDHSYHEQARMAKSLREIRQKRRIFKDTIEKITPFTNWIEDNRRTINGLTRVLGDMRKIDNRQDNRIYYYRADDKGKTIGGERA